MVRLDRLRRHGDRDQPRPAENRFAVPIDYQRRSRVVAGAQHVNHRAWIGFVEERRDHGERRHIGGIAAVILPVDTADRYGVGGGQVPRAGLAYSPGRQPVGRNRLRDAEITSAIR